MFSSCFFIGCPVDIIIKDQFMFNNSMSPHFLVMGSVIFDSNFLFFCQEVGTIKNGIHAFNMKYEPFMLIIFSNWLLN